MSVRGPARPGDRSQPSVSVAGLTRESRPITGKNKRTGSHPPTRTTHGPRSCRQCPVRWSVPPFLSHFCRLGDPLEGPWARSRTPVVRGVDRERDVRRVEIVTTPVTTPSGRTPGRGVTGDRGPDGSRNIPGPCGEETGVALYLGGHYFQDRQLVYVGYPDRHET